MEKGTKNRVPQSKVTGHILQESGKQRAEHITRTLFRISDAVSTTKDLDELYVSIHRILGEVIDLTNFFIAIYDSESGRVSFPYFLDQYDSGAVYADQINEKNSLTGEVIVSEKPLFLNSDDLRKRAARHCVIGTVPLAWMGVPLRIEGEVVGVMAAQCYDEPNRFDLIDLDILNSVSGQVALAIERKRNEQALIFSEKRYRNIIETLEDGYFEMDLSRNLTLVNRAMCSMLGFTREELLDMATTAYMDSRSDKIIKETVNSVFAKGQQGGLFELLFITKEHNALYVEANLSAISNEKGRITGLRGIARDITQRIAEAKVREELQQQLQQSQRLESLGTLAGGITHDFNNLLMGVQGRVELMLNDIEQGHPHYIQLMHIKDYLNHASALTRRLLGFARGGKYEVRPTNPNAVIEKSIRMFNPTRKEITIDTTLPDEAWPVDVDTSQIEQVLVNLFVNASQAIPGQGNITVTTSNRTISDDEAPLLDISAGNYVQITVADDGVGIDPEVISKIFDPFFTTKKFGHGTGLGLSMVYGIIRNHNGSVSVASELFQGTTFTILLPASEHELVEENSSQGIVEKGSELILLVDDESMIIEVGREVLKAIGYEVLTASSGEEALQLYRENKDRIDLIILDMIMPRMSGSEIFDHLVSINPSVKVLLASGYSIDGEAQEILNRGCMGFIQKPFTISELSVKIRKILT